MSTPPSNLESEEKRARGEMTARLAELQRTNDANVQSRLAALNIMEDAVAARIVAEKESRARQRVEKELRTAAEQLEKRVGERTVALKESNQTLRKEASERKKFEVERRKLLGQLAIAEESERRRISRELHDEVGQQVAALILGLKAIETGNGKAGHLVREARRIAEKIGSEIHDLALKLRPSALDDLGLVQALSNYVDDWSARTRIRISFHSGGFGARRVPATVETVLYRIAQEALTNVFKHAQAKHVSLIVEQRPQIVSLIVEDDGQGFDSRRKLGNLKLGIRGMKERAALVDGEATVESQRKKGTTIFVRIPLPPTKKRSNEKNPGFSS